MAKEESFSINIMIRVCCVFPGRPREKPRRRQTDRPEQPELEFFRSESQHAAFDGVCERSIFPSLGDSITHKAAQYMHACSIACPFVYATLVCTSVLRVWLCSD